MAECVLAEIVRRKRSDLATRLADATSDPAPTRRGLRTALARPGARFIMEVKKQSPSGHRSEVGVAEAVDAYAPVADAISVLTDGPFFGGSLEDLRTTRASFDGPILAKDFVIDSRQVREARLHGADAVLAILAVLDDDDAAAVMSEARRFGMDVIVEVHDEVETGRALALGASIIGINNRSLRTLKTDLSVTERLSGQVPDDVIVISESGIRIRADAERLSTTADAFLVGSSLMASDDIALAARSLVYGPVKICGLTNIEDVAHVADTGATHAGFIFAEDSPRYVGAAATALIQEAHSHSMKAVGVFRDQDQQRIASIAEAHRLDAVQLHGGKEGLQHLRADIPEGCEIWAACGVGEQAEPARAGADRSLFDTMLGGRSGGTGQTFDWQLISGREDLEEAFLAGGICPSNARAAQWVGAFGLDVGSAIESAPGRKDPSKLADLFDALRLPCRRTEKCG